MELPPLIYTKKLRIKATLLCHSIEVILKEGSTIHQARKHYAH